MANITFTKGSGLNDSIYGNYHAPIAKIISDEGEAWEQKSVIDELFDVRKTDKFAEAFTSLTAMDNWEVTGENGAHPVNGMQEGYRKLVEPLTWKSSFSISREMIEDSMCLDMEKKPVQFTNAYYRTREECANALYGAAISGNTSLSFAGGTFDLTTGDGLCLFSKVHKSKLDKGTQSNQFADEFSNEALAAMETAMQLFKGENGETLDISPDTIVIPNIYSLKMAVFAAIGSDKDPTTSNNGYNYNFGRWKVIVSPYLNKFITTGTEPWVLIDSRHMKQTSGAVWLERTALDVTSFVDNGTDANVWNGYSRFTAGFVDWRFASVGGVTGGSELIA